MGASANSLINRPILASIHTQAFQHNLSRVRQLAPESKIWAVIKARAYGHGFAAALKGLSSTDGFALLDIQDAVWLREQGWQGRILLLEGLFHENELDLAQELHCDLVAHCETQVDWLERYAKNVHKTMSVFLKMNTGMNRLGFKPNAYRTAFHRLHAAGYRMHHMTHFANADQIDRLPSVGGQLDLFEQTIEGLQAPTSLANSAAILWHRNALGDWVRPGIMLYGCSPFPEQSAQAIGVRPVMTLCSGVIAVQSVAPGARVGYSGTFVAPRAMRIGVVACGYADGYPRHAPGGTPILVNGRRTQTLGRVSMDMLFVDLDDLPEEIGRAHV